MAPSALCILYNSQTVVEALFCSFVLESQVHMCNKLASRHVRVGLASPSDVPCCDICENAPAFFYCEVDGSSLCLQCDMIVHVGGKRTHRRYLLFRQRVEFPGDKPGRSEELGLQPLDQKEVRKDHIQPPSLSIRENQQNRSASPVAVLDNNIVGDYKMDNRLIDLNTRPQRMNGQASTSPVYIFPMLTSVSDSLILYFLSFYDIQFWISV
ncbi:unnamed protein product [Prunus armeniaca]